MNAKSLSVVDGRLIAFVTPIIATAVAQLSPNVIFIFLLKINY